MSEPCQDCNHPVRPSDPYFATPCGTFCSECMEGDNQHASQCGVCAQEFDLTPEPQEP